MTTPKQFTAKLADKKACNEKFTQYKFELVEPSEMAFEAGQYISLLVDQEGHRRSYSISSTPDISHGFELIVDGTPQGIGVKFLEQLQFGDQVSLLSPLGRFVVDSAYAGKPLAFVATGSGIAPFHGMILNQLQGLKNTVPITLYWGLRFVEDLFWQDEFEQLAEKFPNFHFHPVISRPVPGWSLCQGRVTDCLFVHDLAPDTHFHLCGNERMITDVIEVLKKRDIPESQIHHEKFY